MKINDVYTAYVSWPGEGKRLDFDIFFKVRPFLINKFFTEKMKDNKLKRKNVDISAFVSFKSLIGFIKDNGG